MKRMLNVSNHVMGVNQLEEIHNLGYDLVELPDNLKSVWGQLTPDNYLSTCNDIVAWAEENNIEAFHLAGFPAAVTALCIDLQPTVPVYYAYSERVSVEEAQPDGSVVKKNVFKHKGFYQYVRIPQKKMN
nr:MAG TPA: hypothetical protein [Caudoviricetes sp.]